MGDINPHYWGKGSWAIVFLIIYRYYRDFDQMSMYLDNLFLPCSGCRKNLEEEKKKADYHSFQDPNDTRNFYIDIYNKHYQNDQIDKVKISQFI